MCAHAVRVAMQKIEGVESAKVSLNEGNVKVQLKAGNRVHLKQLRTAVTDQGFSPREATITAVGDVVASGDGLQLRVSGTGDVFEVVEGSGAKLEPRTGLVVTGVVSTPKTDKERDQIKITGTMAAMK